jgi:formate dehydrogenase beta subunit
MGAWDRAPVCAIGHAQVMRATTESIAAAVARGAHAGPYPCKQSFDVYVRGGGYELLRQCQSGARTRDELIKAVGDAGPARAS